MTRIVSLIAVAWHIVVHFLALPLRRRGADERRFLDNYAPERLLPMPAAACERLPAFERCIACGLCDTLCETLARAPRHLFAGPSWLATTARSPVDFPDFAAHFDHHAHESDCAECRACEALCPTGVPLRDLAEFVRATSARIRTDGGGRAG